MPAVMISADDILKVLAKVTWQGTFKEQNTVSLLMFMLM